MIWDDGFKVEDRERLVRIEERQQADTDANKLWHKNRAEECNKIQKLTGHVHEDVTKLEGLISRKRSWLAGVRGTITLICLVVLALSGLGVAIWTAIKT